MDKDFVQKHRDILSYKRGNGLWLWKPYLIFECLKRMKEGQILFYLDAGAFWVRSAKPIFKILREEEFFISGQPLVEKQFTKKCVLEYFGTDPDSNQILGTFGFRKTERTIQFVGEWLELCCNSRFITPDIENVGIDDTYIAHREDQSIFSCLSKREQIRTHKDPTQYGVLPEKYHSPDFIFKPLEYPNDTYKPMVALHRTGDLKFKTCLNQWLCCMLPKGISKKMIKNG